MRKKPLGCGVATHDIDCLCDVKISGEPWEVKVTIPYDFFCGVEIVERFNLGVPWTGADLATFLEAYAQVRRHYNRNGVITHYPDKDTNEDHRRGNSKLTVEQLAILKDWIRAGGTPTPLRDRVKAEFGVTIHKSYVAKLKVRMIEKGEF